MTVSQSPPSAALHGADTEAQRAGATVLQSLEFVCEDIFDRWDADMRSGKLLSALSGRVANYDPRVTAIRSALAAYPDLVDALQGLVAAASYSPSGSTEVPKMEVGKVYAFSISSANSIQTALHVARAAIAKAIGAAAASPEGGPTGAPDDQEKPSLSLEEIEASKVSG